MSEREEAIDVIESIMHKYEEDEHIMLGDEEYKALRFARDSLKTDEAYQLEYEKPEFCEDCISRADAHSLICNTDLKHHMSGMSRKVFKDLYNGIDELPPVTPQEPRKGEWLRMSDLSEQEDYRYKCSRCGNVINHKSKMDLYTFNSWCGRCGSDNGIHINYEVEE